MVTDLPNLVHAQSSDIVNREGVGIAFLEIVATQVVELPLAGSNGKEDPAIALGVGSSRGCRLDNHVAHHHGPIGKARWEVRGLPNYAG